MYFKARHYALNNWRTLLIGVIAVVAVVVAVVMFVQSRANAERVAQSHWLRTQDALKQENYRAAIDLATTLETDYGSTKIGKRAILVRARAQAGLGMLEEARISFEEASDKLSDDPVLWTASRRGLAVLLEDRGEFVAAAAAYDEIGRSGEPVRPRIFDLAAAARCHEAAGQTDQAVAALETLVDEFESETERPASDYVHMAKVKLAEIRNR